MLNVLKIKQILAFFTLKILNLRKLDELNEWSKTDFKFKKTKGMHSTILSVKLYLSSQSTHDSQYANYTSGDQAV